MSIDNALARIQQISSRWSAPVWAGVPLGGLPSRDGAATSSAASFADAYQAASSTSAAGAELDAQTSVGAGGAAAATPYADLFAAAAARTGIPAGLLSAVAQVESNYRIDAVSAVGAQGLMQFMPQTSVAMGVDPWDPASAIDGAARLLAGHLKRFGTIQAALAAYNTGSGTVAAAGGQVPASAVGYVQRVMDRYLGGSR